jgi:bacterioferritin-associated ferredoxin
MNGLFAFIEQKEYQTQQAKALVLPLLEALEAQRPWTSANFWLLYQSRQEQDPVVQQALEHLRQYAIPLLEYEEQLGHLDLEAFAERMASFEQRFWEERYAHEGNPSQAETLYLCGVHNLRESDVRGLAQQSLYDVEMIASALGVPQDCPTCKRGIQRVVLEELKRVKAHKIMA